MTDIRGPFIKDLAEQPGERLYWRYHHTEADELRGAWLCECVRYEGEWWSVRQIGPDARLGVTAYDWRHIEDEHGFLADQPLPPDAPGGRIGAEEFERAWRTARPVTTLWRPVGQRELELVQESGWRRFPPRLEGQPIFYPVLNEAYATRIAREWNTKDPAPGHVGHVLRFEVEDRYLTQFPPRRVGGAGIDELWIPAERLAEFNDEIVGAIALVATYRAG